MMGNTVQVAGLQGGANTLKAADLKPGKTSDKVGTIKAVQDIGGGLVKITIEDVSVITVDADARIIIGG
jgi:hypothetical protein